MSDASITTKGSIDLNKIQEKLKSMEQANITLNINTKEILSKVSYLEKELESLAAHPYKIKLEIDPNIQDRIHDLQQQLGSLNNQSRGKRNTSSRNRDTNKNNINQFAGFPVSRRKWATKYRDAANAEEQKAIQSLIGKNSTLISTSGKLRFDKTGKEVGADWLVTYRNEIGKTIKTVLDYNKATDKWKVTSANISTNYEAQGKELEKVNNYLSQQKNAYKNLEQSAFLVNGLDKNSSYGKEAKKYLDDLNEEIEKLEQGQSSYDGNTRRAIANKREEAKRAIAEQKELVKIQKEQEKADAARYKRDLKYNSSQVEYNRKQELKKEETHKKAIQEITKAENDVSTIEKNVFSGTYALTGEYKEEAIKQIEEIRNKLKEFKEDASSSYEKALSVSKDDLKIMTKTLGEDLGRIQKLEYPSDKMAAQNVDVKKAFATESLDEMQKKLESLNMTSSDFADRLNTLRDSLQNVGKIGGDTSAWANWRNEMQLLERDINKFDSSTQGKGIKLAFDIEDNQMQKIEDTINMLNNIDSKYSGSGVEAVKQNLQSLAVEYQQVMDQLRSTDLNDEQFDALTKRVKELGGQLNQAVSSVKMFGDGVKNNSSLEKFDQRVENLKLKFEQLKTTYADLISRSPEIASKFEQIGNEINSVDPVNIQNVSGAVNNLGKECQVASGQTAGLRGALESAFGGVGKYISNFASAFYLIRKGISVIKSMVNEVKAVDSSLVELQKVTDLTGSSLDQFVEKAYNVGKGLGRTGQDVIDATTTFSRAGYNLQEATKLAQSALVMTNVGVDIPNMESAASDMISILKAFDVQAEDSMEVIDKLYNVSNKQPLDFGNLTQMLVTAGGTLAQTGTTLDETMGLLTAAYATMRDTSVSNG